MKNVFEKLVLYRRHWANISLVGNWLNIFKTCDTIVKIQERC